MPIVIDLTLCNRFANAVNTIVAIGVWLFMVVYAPNELPFYVHLLAVTLLSAITVLFHWQGRNPTGHIIFVEGADSGKLVSGAFGLQDMSLNEYHSKITYFGCWLAFSHHTEKRFFWQFWKTALYWVFVPKALLPISDYKSVCRQILWYNKD